MTDRFSVIHIYQLFRIIISDFKNGIILGIPRELFFTPAATDKFRMYRFGKLLESPIGVAAGPHSQMAQNIIAAWLCGARYIELKTVQTLDELNVSKPCIDMQDEGYNCEWSQELKLNESFEQYLDAWIIIHALKHLFGRKDSEAGFIFNMSVGYNMEGILNENVQWFFDKMKDAKAEKNAKIKILASFFPDIKKISIPNCISDNITLSTMHGCPPSEIEKIGLYLIQNKKLHTTIKLNPTLLGKKELRHILNTKLGFETHVPDEAFEHDLKYPEAIKIIAVLSLAAHASKVFFGLKLTNTLEAENHKNVFPPNEKMMYMSGRALHPISINLANKLQRDFKGALDISFSAGADCFNIFDIVSSGMKPVTVCSDILKPGGYGRLHQYIENLRMYATLNMSVDKKALKFLSDYAEQVQDDNVYAKNPFFTPSIKIGRELTTFDCIKAPCVDSCPTNQDIPEYLYYTSTGDFQKAYEVIMRTNPFPNVLGMVCDHFCQAKCTRTNYDNAVLIREVKRFIASQKLDEKFLVPQSRNNLKAVIIGAGPSGLACAYFLTLAGYEVNVYETKVFAGGMVSDAIPAFRLTESAIKKDIDRILKLGVKIHYNSTIGKKEFDKFQKDNDFIYIAVGAQKAKKLEIENEDAPGVLNSLKFLADVRRGNQVAIGKNVLVIGGGNTAMDVARTAKRLVGINGKVTVVYRRTKYEMPADKEEIQALFEEHIPVIELTAPEKIITKKNILRKVTLKALRCCKMELSGHDKSGRLKPVKIEGSEFDIPCDTIIPALGQDVVLDFMDASMLISNELNYETKLKNVFIGGDAMRGGSTIIKAVADGKKAAQKIIAASGRKNNIADFTTEKNISLREHTFKRAKRKYGIDVPETKILTRREFDMITSTLNKKQAIEEASRCLFCDDVCNVCVSVCPNRANFSYQVQPISGFIYHAQKKPDGTVGLFKIKPFSVTQKYQILNVSDFCNECGNCSTFCPTSGRPFADKPKIYLTEKSFIQAEKGYFYKVTRKSKVLKRKDGKSIATLTKFGGMYIFGNEFISAVFDEKTLNIQHVEFLKVRAKEYTFEIIPEMCLLYDAAVALY